MTDAPASTSPIRSLPELLGALRGRVADLGITHSTIDDLAGFHGGYASKLLAPTPIKNLGQMSLQALLGALGIALVVVEDPEQVARVQGRWVKRRRSLPKIPSASMSASIQNEVPATIPITADFQRKLVNLEHMKRIAKLGAKRRNKIMGKRARQRAATHAARIRWQRERERRA